MLVHRGHSGNGKLSSSQPPMSGRRVVVRPNRKEQRKKKLIFMFTFSFAVCFLIFLNLWGHQRITSESEDRLLKSLKAIPPQSNSTLFSRANVRRPTNQACDGYQGIYHIEKGDIGGAAGTIFFQFVIGQIIWAEKYNFKPWVHLNNVSYVVYDPVVHGKGPGVTFPMLDGLKISYVQPPVGHWRDAYPGEPYDFDKIQPKMFHFDGDGVWDNYFEPVSDFVPGDTSCQNKPLVTMDIYLVTPGVHGFAPWAPRCWRYTYLPDYITKPHIPLHDWLEPQRHAANDVLKRYIKFKPFIEEKAERINPGCSLENPCLGIHIRQSDKAGGRRQIQTDEFLPYVEEFFKHGGSWVYLATDSEKVMDHVKTKWPEYIRDKVRSIGDDIVRSNDHQAVFDIASHHQTNTEILYEILALSKCQFMVHGLSAVTESSIWINVDLHYTSINLEDPEHLNSREFGALIRKVLNGANAANVYKEHRSFDWWNVDPFPLETKPSNHACDGVKGILHIFHVGEKATVGTAFFVSVLNQLYYAEQNNLKPWIHLDSESSMIYFDGVHGRRNVGRIHGMTNKVFITSTSALHNNSSYYPGKLSERNEPENVDITLRGDGIWNHYFQQVSDFVPGDQSCEKMPFLSMSNELVTPGLYSWAPWAIRPWRYDDVPDKYWKPENMSYKIWMAPMRQKASELVQKYFKFHPNLIARADVVNPINATSPPCMAIHLRNSNNGKSKFRGKLTLKKVKAHIDAFIQAGGQTIYFATDSNIALEEIQKRYPAQIRKTLRTQGRYVVRASSKWPTHMLEENRHRTNSEVLVDILAMSKCRLFLHGHSAISEAAIYLNPELHNNSVNFEDPDFMPSQEFEELAREVLGTKGQPAVPLSLDVDPSERVANVTILKGNEQRLCKKNAIVYLAQKRHSTYARDSYDNLLQSMQLLQKNYLSIEDRYENADIFVFHTAEFTAQDLDAFEDRLGKDFRNAVRLVDLNGTKYWKRPSWHKFDNPLDWYAFAQFGEGYRRMIHWFAIDIWQFFRDHGQETGCEYEYIMRFDEDSYLHSKIKYDVFEFMKDNDYNYGFRLCAYEMQVTQRIWKLWLASKGSPPPLRDIDLEMCGAYNNFFVAKISFFLSPPVQKFLHFVDRQGMIYRRRLGDLMIHSMAIYGFSSPEKIHRFLDFTYEHATDDQNSGCVVWGGIQAGYDDPNSDKTIAKYMEEKVTSKGCGANITMLRGDHLSPTYSHLPDNLMKRVVLKSVMAGKVELPYQGILSG